VAECQLVTEKKRCGSRSAHSIVIKSGGEVWQFLEEAKIAPPASWSAKNWPPPPVPAASNTYIVETLHQHNENTISIADAKIEGDMQLTAGSGPSYQANARTT
jgi:hypothetical protein